MCVVLRGEARSRAVWWSCVLVAVVLCLLLLLMCVVEIDGGWRWLWGLLVISVVIAGDD